MQKILQGVRHFHDDIFPEQREEFERLAAKQQKPRALFITCSDSRVHPNLITQTDPGDLFLIRNAGNIVPSYGTNTGGEAATIEYALSVLGIKNIIVCGHSHCGAMKALLHEETYNSLPAVCNWFAHAESTKRIAREKLAHLSGKELDTRVVEENVLVQLSHLRTHPSVMVGLAKGEIFLHGWYYCIETGEILAFDPIVEEFVAIDDNSIEHFLPAQKLAQPIATASQT